MTDICVKNISIPFVLRERYWFAVAVVVAAVFVETYLHKWCKVIIGLGNVLASVRRQATTGKIPQFRDSWFKPQGYFIIKQNETNILSSTIYLKTNKNTTTTHSDCEPLSEPMMARCALEIPKFKHDTFGKRAFAVCGPLSWNVGCAMKLKHSSEP